MVPFAGMKLFVIVAANALWPRTQTGGAPSGNTAHDSSSVPPGFVPVTPAAIPAILGDPGQAVNERGELALFFAGLPPLAAPFLLFRLKRLGFSRCRVRVAAGGLALSARR